MLPLIHFVLSRGRPFTIIISFQKTSSDIWSKGKYIVMRHGCLDFYILSQNKHTNYSVDLASAWLNQTESGKLNIQLNCSFGTPLVAIVAVSEVRNIVEALMSTC